MSDKEKALETMLTLATVLAMVYAYNKNIRWLYAAIGFGIIGMFFTSWAIYLSKLWLKLAQLMGAVMSKVILSLVFVVFLAPIAFLYRLGKKDNLNLKKPQTDSFYHQRNHTYLAKDLQNTW